jgi:hypothetical protein
LLLKRENLQEFGAEWILGTYPNFNPDSIMTPNNHRINAVVYPSGSKHQVKFEFSSPAASGVIQHKPIFIL